MSSGTGSINPGSGKGGFVPPTTGDLDAILDQYEFLDLLGRGGMGAVYKAKQKSLDRLVAIKILPPQLATDEEEQGFRFSERFQREARAMARLSHPHIVAVYDFGQARDGQFYFVMEYIEGTDLAALIKGGQMTTAHVTGWMSQICDALQYAHNKGIVHRDIKPANIMITREGQVKVADFGLAKLAGAEAAAQTKLTMTNMAMGTPDYVAPEALEEGVEVDHRADLYALGVMLYEMLTGKVPRGAWRPPSTQIAGLDPRYDELIDRAMDADRESRFQQASEISATIYQIATTPADPAKPAAAAPSGGRRTMVTGEAAGVASSKAVPAEESTRPKSPAGKNRPGTRDAPLSKGKSPVGLIVALVIGALGMGLGGFFWLKPKLFPPVAPAPVAIVPPSTPFTPPTTAPPPAIPQPAPAPSPAPTPEPSQTTPPPIPAPEPAPAVAAVPAAPDTVDTAPWTDAISLLPLVDVEQDAVRSKWRREGSDLISNGKYQPALMALPIVASEEYDFRLRFTIQGGDSHIGLILSRGDRSFVWKGGDFGNTLFGFGVYQGTGSLKMSNPSAKTVPSCFAVRQNYLLQIAVRKTGVAAYLNGAKVSELPADLAEMQPPPGWSLSTPGTLGFGTVKTECAFHSAELRAVTGQAKLLREAPAPATTPAMTKAPAMTPPATAPPAPNDPVTLRLAELEKAFLTAYDQQVAPKHDAAVAALNTNYLARLDRDIAAASQAGKLEDALALRDERTQVQTHGALPAEDAPTLAAALKPLRATYRGTLTTLLKQRDLAAAPLYAAYDRTLSAYQDELTKAQQLDQAARVKAVREHIATQRESAAKPVATAGASATPAASVLPPVGQKSAANLPPVPVAPPLPASQVLPPPPKASQEDIRALADWLFRFNGNTISIAEGPESRIIRESASLPRGNLKVVGVHIYEIPSEAETAKHLATLSGLADLEELIVTKQGGKLPIESLRGLTKLKKLSLGAGKFDDSGFAHLSGLKNLKWVGFGSIAGFTGTGLGYLGEDITELFLSENRHLTAEGLAYLSRFRKLRTLDLHQCANLRDEMLRPLAGLLELEAMDVWATSLDGTFLNSLPDNSKLNHLRLGSTTKFQPQHLSQLGRLKNLESVAMPNLDPPVEAMTALASLGKLRELTMEPPFTGETLAGVTGFRSLTTLDLSASPVADAGWAAIVQAMPELNSLSLFRPAGSTAPQNAAAMGEQIGRLKNLRFLSFGGPTFTDDWLVAASRAKNLDSLHVSSPLVTDAGLVHLQDLPLTGLRINGTSITDASIPTLKKFPKLIGNYIYFAEKMSPAGIAEVKAHCDNRKK